MTTAVLEFTGRAPRNDHRWTDDEIKRLIGLWMDGTPVAAIALQLGVSERAITKRVQILRSNGIPVPRRKAGHTPGRQDMLWTQEEVEYVIRRRGERATVESIANELDRTFYAIQGMIYKLRSEGVAVRKFGQGRYRLWSSDRAREAILMRGLRGEEETLASPQLSQREG